MTIKVTSEQQRLIDEKRGIGGLLKIVIDKVAKKKYQGEEVILNDMTDEQIAAAWLGVAEIEREYVSLGEAIKRSKEGYEVLFYDGSGKLIGGALPIEVEQYPIEHMRLGRCSLLELYEGNWVIKEWQS
jgi:hypothetical protein